MSVGVVRWPLTYPAPSVPGFIVSDRLHQVIGSIAGFGSAASPPDILSLLQAPSATSNPEDVPATPVPGMPESSALARDRMYSSAADKASTLVTPRFLAVRYDGLDIVGHY